jgi:membrane protein
MGVIVLPMLVLGPDLLRRSFPRSVRPTVSQLITEGYYPTLIVLLLLGLTTFYKFAPPRRLPWHRGLPGAVLGLLVFLAGSAGLRAYINFVLDHNHAYGALAAPIAALLFFFVLALGVLLGAELNASIEHKTPSKVRQPRVLDPRSWRVYEPEMDETLEQGAPAEAVEKIESVEQIEPLDIGHDAIAS